MSLRVLSPLHKATRQIEVFLGARMGRLGIRGGGGHLLSYLHGYGPCRVGELQRVFGYRPSTLTSIFRIASTRGKTVSTRSGRRLCSSSWRDTCASSGDGLDPRINAKYGRIIRNFVLEYIKSEASAASGDRCREAGSERCRFCPSPLERSP